MTATCNFVSNVKPKLTMQIKMKHDLKPMKKSIKHSLLHILIMTQRTYTSTFNQSMNHYRVSVIGDCIRQMPISTSKLRKFNRPQKPTRVYDQELIIFDLNSQHYIIYSYISSPYLNYTQHDQSMK